MPAPEMDQRIPERRASDERIASEPQMAPLELPLNATFSPMETLLGRDRRRPIAVAGLVENGLVRPLDSAVKLTEHSRVIIVATEGA